MNPRTQFEPCSVKLSRAFAHLFIHCSDQFKFSADSSTEDTQEISAHLSRENAENEESIVLRATGLPEITNRDQLAEIKRVCKHELGLVAIDKMSGTKQTEELDNEYEESAYEYDLTRYQPLERKQYDWNVPHLIVYGSLNPEVREACELTFRGTNIEYTNIRNHYVVYGENLVKKHITELSEKMDEVYGFGELERDAQMELSTATFI